MRKLLLTTAFGLIAGMAHAGITVDQVAAAMAAAGYTNVEVVSLGATIKAEGSMNGSEVEVIYDAETGTILKQEGSPGTVFGGPEDDSPDAAGTDDNGTDEAGTDDNGNDGTEVDDNGEDHSGSHDGSGTEADDDNGGSSGSGSSAGSDDDSGDDDSGSGDNSGKDGGDDSNDD